MKYLFFIISLIYSFVFYCFYTLSLGKDIFFKPLKNISFSVADMPLVGNGILFSSKTDVIFQSIFGNTLPSVIVFLVIGVVLFILFSGIKKEESNNTLDIIGGIKSMFSKDNLKSGTKIFAHYIGFILFYLSIFFISKSFSFISFGWLIFIINIIIFAFFYISKHSQISFTFLRINTILFSISYVFSYLYIIISKNNFFGVIDFINSFLVIISFPLYIYYDKIINHSKKINDSVIVHFSVYIFGVFLFYLNLIINSGFIFWISFIASLFGILWFVYFPKLFIFKGNKFIFKYIGIIFSYIGSIFGVIYLLLDFSFLSYIISIILIGQSIYNYLIHNKYSNYISYVISLFLGCFMFYFILLHFNIFYFKTVEFFILNILFSIIFIVASYIFKLKLNLDYFIMHIFSYLINIIGIILYLIYNVKNIEILYVGIFLLVESLYFFASYNKLKE